MNCSKRKFSVYILSGALAASSAMPVLAEISAQSELGFVLTDGNTETQTLNANLKVNHLFQKWENIYQLSALSSSESDETSAERYTGEVQTNRSFTERSYAFGNVSYERDRFSGFQYQSTLSAGYGYKVVNEEDLKISLEAGPGVRFLKPEETAAVPDPETDDEALLRLFGDLEYQISESSKFNQSIEVDSGEDRTISESVTALTSQIAGSLAMKVSITVRNNSEPATVELDKTDTETAVTLVYDF